jgi:hypothetical protein
VFTPSICTSEADSYWFDLDLPKPNGFIRNKTNAKENGGDRAAGGASGRER